MYKVIFHNLNETIAPFETLELAQAWLDKQLAKPKYLGLESAVIGLKYSDKILITPESSVTTLDPVFDADGNPVMVEAQVHVLLDNGEEAYDANGEPIMETGMVQDTVENTVVTDAVYEERVNELFSHERATTPYDYVVVPSHFKMVQDTLADGTLLYNEDGTPSMVEGTEIVPEEVEKRFDIAAEYTYEIINITAEVELEKVRANRRKTGRKVINLTNAIMETIIGFNMDNPSNIPVLKSTFSDIHTLLKDYQPYDAKPLIEAIVVDSVVTQDMKDEVLALYL